MMRIVSVATLVLAAACANKTQVASDSASRRRADSAIGASAIPGAQGVNKALVGADSAAARAAGFDSLNKQP